MINQFQYLKKGEKKLARKKLSKNQYKKFPRDWIKKVEEIKGEKNKRLTDTDNRMVITRVCKGGREKVGKGKGEINGKGRRFDSGW